MTSISLEEAQKKVQRAQEIGERIFGSHSPVHLERAGFRKRQPSDPAFIETLGRYDYLKDIIRVYYARIQTHCKTNRIDFDSALQFILCHEIGHSSHARIFEKANIFPYRFQIYRTCPIRIDSETYDLREIKVGGREFHKAFMFGIDDYAIDKKMQEHGMKCPLSGTYVQTLLRIPRVKLTERESHRLMVTALLFLPYHVDLHAHGDISKNQRRELAGYYRNLVGDKWRLASKIMKRLTFDSPQEYAVVLSDLFKELLQLHCFQRKMRSSDLFSCYETIPSFWNKSSYQVFVLTPLEIGKIVEDAFSLRDSLAQD